MNNNSLYRSYDNIVYFPNGERYYLDPDDMQFPGYDVKQVTEYGFVFGSPYEAQRFEQEVKKRAQFYYYNRRQCWRKRR